MPPGQQPSFWPILRKVLSFRSRFRDLFIRIGRGILYRLLLLLSILLLALQFSFSFWIGGWRRNLARGRFSSGHLRQTILALVLGQGFQSGIHLFPELVVHLL